MAFGRWLPSTSLALDWAVLSIVERVRWKVVLPRLEKWKEELRDHVRGPILGHNLLAALDFHLRQPNWLPARPSHLAAEVAAELRSARDGEHNPQRVARWLDDFGEYLFNFYYYIHEGTWPEGRLRPFLPGLARDRTGEWAGKAWGDLRVPIHLSRDYVAAYHDISLPTSAGVTPSIVAAALLDPTPYGFVLRHDNFLGDLAMIQRREDYVHGNRAALIAPMFAGSQPSTGFRPPCGAMLLTSALPAAFDDEDEEGMRTLVASINRLSYLEDLHSQLRWESESVVFRSFPENLSPDPTALTSALVRRGAYGFGATTGEIPEARISVASLGVTALTGQLRSLLTVGSETFFGPTARTVVTDAVPNLVPRVSTEQACDRLRQLEAFVYQADTLGEPDSEEDEVDLLGEVLLHLWPPLPPDPVGPKGAHIIRRLFSTPGGDSLLILIDSHTFEAASGTPGSSQQSVDDAVAEIGEALTGIPLRSALADGPEEDLARASQRLEAWMSGRPRERSVESPHAEAVADGVSKILSQLGVRAVLGFRRDSYCFPPASPVWQEQTLEPSELSEAEALLSSLPVLTVLASLGKLLSMTAGDLPQSELLNGGLPFGACFLPQMETKSGSPPDSTPLDLPVGAATLLDYFGLHQPSLPTIPILRNDRDGSLLTRTALESRLAGGFNTDLQSAFARVCRLVGTRAVLEGIEVVGVTAEEAVLRCAFAFPGGHRDCCELGLKRWVAPRLTYVGVDVAGVVDEVLWTCNSLGIDTEAPLLLPRSTAETLGGVADRSWAAFRRDADSLGAREREALKQASDEQARTLAHEAGHALVPIRALTRIASQPTVDARIRESARRAETATKVLLFMLTGMGKPHSVEVDLLGGHEQLARDAVRELAAVGVEMGLVLNSWLGGIHSSGQVGALLQSNILSAIEYDLDEVHFWPFHPSDPVAQLRRAGAIRLLLAAFVNVAQHYGYYAHELAEQMPSEDVVALLGESRVEARVGLTRVELINPCGRREIPRMPGFSRHGSEDVIKLASSREYFPWDLDGELKPHGRDERSGLWTSVIKLPQPFWRK